MNKGFTFVELLIVLCIVTLLSLIAVPNFLEAETRAGVASAADNQNRMAMALSTYNIDYDAYPSYWPFSTGGGYVAPMAVVKNYNKALFDVAGYFGNTSASNVPTFAFPPTGSGHGIGLTTPVAYLTTYPVDEFGPFRPTTYNFVGGAQDFLVWSWGPDGTDQLDGGTNTSFGHKAAEYIVRGNQPLPSPYLLAGPTVGILPLGAPRQGTGAFTYNPTNGTASSGDIWRTRRSGVVSR